MALACRCTEPGPRQAYRAAESVVYGKVLSAKRDNEGSDTAYLIDVAESWKQPVETQITVHTSTTCAFVAEVGKGYVLFLRQPSRGSYETAMCMGNRSAEKSRELLKFLRAQTPRR